MRLIEKLIELELTFNASSYAHKEAYKMDLPIREANTEEELLDILEKDALTAIRGFNCIKEGNTVLACKAGLYQNKWYGPYLVLCKVDNKYMELEGVIGVVETPMLEDNESYLIQCTSDVLRVVIAKSPALEDGKWNGSLVLQLRADMYNNCGIAKVA